VLTDKGWKYVFCHNTGLADPITTPTKAKAIPAHKHSMGYFTNHYPEHKFKYSAN